jgi:hypothetical protein
MEGHLCHKIPREEMLRVGLGEEEGNMVVKWFELR